MFYAFLIIIIGVAAQPVIREYGVIGVVMMLIGQLLIVLVAMGIKVRG